MLMEEIQLQVQTLHAYVPVSNKLLGRMLTSHADTEVGAMMLLLLLLSQSLLMYMISSQNLEN